jgi:elongation factor Ts
VSVATAISASDVKALRERTGAGMMDCKAALQEAGGDLDKAVEILRVKGQAQAAKRGGRTASEGLVTSYVHATGKIGVLVEVDCETDFVARNEQFQEFGRDVSIHIAAAAPQYVSEEEVPEEVREAELRIFREQAAASGAKRSGPSGARGKPEQVQEKIAEGRMRKWLEEVVLLRQRHVNEDKYGGKTIEELRTELAASTGENVVIRRFARFQIGEE